MGHFFYYFLLGQQKIMMTLNYLYQESGLGQRMNKKEIGYKFAALVVIVLLLVNCGGRAAYPIMAQEPSDHKKSCKTLIIEIVQIQGEIHKLIPQTHKTGRNILFAAAGWFLIFPFSYMDFSKAEQVEIEALIQRYNHLIMVGKEKNCGFDENTFPEFDKKIKRDSKKKKTIKSNIKNLKRK